MDKIRYFGDRISQLIGALDFQKEPPELYDPIAYTMNQGGKRLRPLLTLLACDLFGGNIEKALYPALSIEVFHNFTLVHDDIMDKAPLRRGKETVFKKWNPDIAILAGDTMFALAYTYALKTDAEIVPEILTVFSKAAIEVCEGQQYDMNFEQLQSVSIEDYINMIRLKTAVLLGASLEIGAICARANTEDVRNLYNFGIELGIAFQLKDDLLDVYGDTETFGKFKGGDIAANKKTYLFLKALEKAGPEQRDQLQYWFSQPSDRDVNLKINSVKSIFDSIGVQAITEEIMTGYFERSLGFLSRVEAKTEQKKDLVEFATRLFNRTH
jgi:geranylgeranyl diphosphate synthase type II